MSASLVFLVSATSHAASREEAACAVADPVRIRLDGIEYRVPAVLQPDYSPADAIPTRDYVPEGRRARQYCQPPDAPPPAVRTFSVDHNALAAFAAKDARFPRLAGIYPLVIYARPADAASAGPPSAAATAGELSEDGLFRRVEHKGSYELFSTRPLLFGSPVSARCAPAATPQPSTWCTIWGRLRAGSLVRLDVLDTTVPRAAWPETLAQVERFISWLMQRGDDPG